jgi:hypothetical protein
MHLRICKYCNVAFKTPVIHSKVCDICKVKKYQEISLIKKKNRAKTIGEKQIRDEKIKEMEEVIKEDPFAMIRM